MKPQQKSNQRKPLPFREDVLNQKKKNPDANEAFEVGAPQCIIAIHAEPNSVPVLCCHIRLYREAEERFDRTEKTTCVSTDTSEN